MKVKALAGAIALFGAVAATNPSFAIVELTYGQVDAVTAGRSPFVLDDFNTTILNTPTRNTWTPST